MKMVQVHCSGICHRLILLGVSRTSYLRDEGKVHPFTSTEALYRPYGP